MEFTHIETKKVSANEGQVPGLPRNPRTWTKTEMADLKASLQETPELFEARGVIVYPYEGKFVAIGGNMRLAASKSLRLPTIPCIVLPEDTKIDKLREIAAKDNGSFGKWNFDALANKWSDLPLTSWGIPAWETKEETSGKDEAQDDGFEEDAQPILVRCKPGDVWQLGEHRLMCGDSVDLEDVKKLMGGGVK